MDQCSNQPVFRKGEFKLSRFESSGAGCTFVSCTGEWVLEEKTCDMNFLFCNSVLIVKINALCEPFVRVIIYTARTFCVLADPDFGKWSMLSDQVVLKFPMPPWVRPWIDSHVSCKRRIFGLLESFVKER